MEAFEPTQPGLNAIGTAVQWIQDQVAAGRYPEQLGHRREAAVRKLAVTLREEEPRSAEYMLDHLDELSRRLHGSSADLGVNIVMDAKIVLSDYVSTLT